MFANQAIDQVCDTTVISPTATALDLASLVYLLPLCWNRWSEAHLMDVWRNSESQRRSCSARNQRFPILILRFGECLKQYIVSIGEFTCRTSETIATDHD